MNAFIQNAQEELSELEQRLEQELAASPTYAKIKLLRALIAAYGVALEVNKLLEQSPALSEGTNGSSRPESRKAKIKKAVRFLIQRDGGQTKRKAILAYLAEQGIVSGPKAVRVVAPILTESEEFKTNGKGTWRLAGDPQQLPPIIHGGDSENR